MTEPITNLSQPVSPPTDPTFDVPTFPTVGKSALQLVPISSVIIPPDRQRKENKSTEDIADLKKSILKRGLLHAPVVTWAGEPGNSPCTLIAGERRYLSMSELHVDGLEFYYNGDPVLHGMMPWITLTQMTEEELLEVELDENVLRENLTWQEHAIAQTKLHRLRQAQNPGQTMVETATEIVRATAGIQASKDASRIEGGRFNLVMATTVAEHLSNPKVARAKNMRSAYRQIVDIQKANLERTLQQITPSRTDHKCLQGDCREVMKTLEKNSFDTIIVDPPYGVDADKMEQDSKHNYQDDKKYALSVCQEILRYGFHLLKPEGIGFMFCDVEHFTTLRLMAEQQAFSTWRKPIIWHKGKEGHAPWGRNGFAYTYECLLFFIKGQKALVKNPGSDVVYFERTSRFEKLHAAEKPVELLQWLLEISSRPGDRVLDPCCGSGPLFLAAKGLKLSVTGIEVDDTYHAMACGRLLKLDESEADAGKT